MLKNQDNAKVVDGKCKATSTNNHQENERGYWIHINHFFNCYPDCKIYLSSFDHFLKRKRINILGLIMIPFNHEIFSIGNVACCVICSDTKCYMCKNLKDIIDGRKSLCSCNEDLKDDHAVNRINWFISNFKMCVTMKERFKPNSKPQLLRQKNDNTNKTKVENGLKETNGNGIKSNIPVVNSECSNRLKVEQCECDKSNIASHSSGIKKKYSKVKTNNKNMNNTSKLKENVSSKSLEINDDKKHEEKPPVDDKKLPNCLAVSVNCKKKNISKGKVCESLTSDIKILTKDSFSRFAEKFDSLNAFGHQCLFCKILGYFYNGKHCDIIIPEFCIRDRRQTTCDKSSNEKHCFGKQYCLTVENTYVESGVGPMLIGAFSNKHIPIVELEKGMNYDKNSKYADDNFENPKSRIRKKPTRLRIPSLAEELKRKEKKE